MIDKSFSRLLIILLAIGGIVILAGTWIRPVLLSERIAFTIFGTAQIVVALIWALVSRVKSAKIRVASLPDKTNVDRETF